MTGPTFLPEALAEYENVVAYYEMQEPGLGARVILEFDDMVALAMEFPDAGIRVKGAPTRYNLRWRLLPMFRIKIVYTVRDNTFIIAAIFHASRRPGYWFDRLRQLR